MEQNMLGSQEDLASPSLLSTDSRPEDSIISSNPPISPSSTVSILSEIMTLAIPIIGTKGIGIAQGFITALITSTIDKDVFAASSLFGSLQTLLLIPATYSTYSTGILVGEACGRNDLTLAGKILVQSGIYSTIISLPIIGFALLSKYVLLILGQNETYAKITGNYFSGFTPAIPALLLLISCQQFADAINKPWIEFLSSAINSAIVLILGYSFSLGKFGFTNLGVTGLGLAYAIASWVTLLGLVIFYRFAPAFKDFNLFNFAVRDNLSILKRLARLGIPIGIKVSFDLLELFMTNIMVGWRSEDEIVAQQTANQYLYLFSAPFMGFAAALTYLVSRAVGESYFT
jgi:MATE family multidrug resistance protein